MLTQKKEYRSPQLIHQDDFSEDLRMIQRLLALRRAGRIAAVFGDGGKLGISFNELQPREEVIYLTRDQAQEFIAHCEATNGQEAKERSPEAVS